MKVVFDNLANFFLFLQTKPQFLPSVCLVPAGHFCRSCFFSSCTLSHTVYVYSVQCTCSHTHMDSTVCDQLCCKYMATVVHIFLTMRSKHASSKILNDIGRNSLLGNRKKIAKFLMRTFTCRSTFLYGCITGTHGRSRHANTISARAVCIQCRSGSRSGHGSGLRGNRQLLLVHSLLHLPHSTPFTAALSVQALQSLIVRHNLSL